MFAQVVKPPSQGGTCGLKVVAEHTYVVGDTINVQWRADSPLLKEPYRGADAYETHDGLMAAQVTTWNPPQNSNGRCHPPPPTNSPGTQYGLIS